MVKYELQLTQGLLSQASTVGDALEHATHDAIPDVRSPSLQYL